MASNREEYLDELEEEADRLRERIQKGELVCAPRLEITKVAVLQRKGGTDLVWVHTTLPSPFPPGVTDQPLTLQFEVRKGAAIDYIRENFGSIPIEVINELTGSHLLV